MEVAWCRGEVLEVSMQVAQCRAQGSVTLPSPAAAWAWHPVLLSPHLASTSSTRASELRAEVTVGLCPQFHGGTWRRRPTRARRANPVAPRAKQPAGAAELAAAAGKACGQGSAATRASSFPRASHGGRSVKTDHGIDRNQPGRFPLSFPRRFAGLATALRNFTAARAAVYPTATHFFELPGERFTEKTNFGDALGRMLGTALTTVSLQPPEGRVYTARSLRSGGASAAEMVPLPRSKIEFLGGWAVDSKRLSQHYISRATPPTYAGRFFFDWLILPLADNMALDFPS